MGSPKPSEFVSRDTELLLDLINDDDKAKKSIKSVGIELNDKLDTAEQNIRMFLAIKAILDTAAEAVGWTYLARAVCVQIHTYGLAHSLPFTTYGWRNSKRSENHGSQPKPGWKKRSNYYRPSILRSSNRVLIP